MVWTIAEKGQNKFSPQCLALCSSLQVPEAIPPAVAAFQASSSPPLLSCCGISHHKAGFLVHHPPHFGSEQELSVLFQGDFGKRARLPFPLAAPFLPQTCPRRPPRSVT